MILINSFLQILSTAISDYPQKSGDGNSKFKLSQFFTLSTSAETENPAKSFTPSSSTTSCISSKHQKHTSWCLEAPCLQFKKNLSDQKFHLHKSLLLKKSANDLSCPLHADRSNIDGMPLKLLCNISISIHQLIRSRLRASIAALIAKTTKLGDFEEADILHRLYLSRRAIDIMNVSTSFCAILGDHDMSTAVRIDENGAIVTPIIFETIMEVSMLGKSNTLKINAPGMISVSLNETNILFKRIRISLDTVTLLKTMMDQVRVVVNKTTKRAARITNAYSKLKLNNSLDSQYFRNKISITDLINSSTPEMTSEQREQVWLNYPTHLRETVEHFNLSRNYIIGAYLERYHPQLARTLILLAQGDIEEDLSRGKEEEGNH